MAYVVNIQKYGDQLALVNDDGTRILAYPTGRDVWVLGRAADPEPPPPSGPRFIWPFPLNQVTSEYGQRNGRLHAGIDFGRGSSNTPGTAIPASAAGTVIVANKTNSHGGYGNAVVIDHGGGLCTLYGHMRFRPDGSADVDVNVGQQVQQGQRLGGIGKTGASQGNHSHFETHEGGYRWNTSSRDPRLFIAKYNG